MRCMRGLVRLIRHAPFSMKEAVQTQQRPILFAQCTRELRMTCHPHLAVLPTALLDGLRCKRDSKRVHGRLFSANTRMPWETVWVTFPITGTHFGSIRGSRAGLFGTGSIRGYQSTTTMVFTTMPMVATLGTPLMIGSSVLMDWSFPIDNPTPRYLRQGACSNRLPSTC